MEFTQIISLLFIFAAAFYLSIHFCLLIGMKRVKYLKSNEQPFVSVIVAARNEQETIGAVLQCLLRQTYTNYEIIIVNDRSTDATAEIVRNFQKNNDRIKRIDITIDPHDMPAKKNALQAGIHSSHGELLCFTDADCFPPPQWIENLVCLFEPEVGFVAGYSPYKVPLTSQQRRTMSIIQKWFFRFIAYEEFRAAVWSSGSIGLSLGWLCTGRNLAYRRKVFDELKGFEKIKISISGDDDLFLQLVRKQTSWKIRYLTTAESFVPTMPPMNIWTFIEQRKRHFSASKYFSLPMKIFFFFYHLSNLCLLLSFVLFFLDLLSLPLFALCICGKLIADTILIFPSIHIFDSHQFRLLYPLMEVLYVFYNSIIGPLGLLQRFEWKPNQS